MDEAERLADAERKRAIREYFRVDLDGDRRKFTERTRYTKGRVTQILSGEEPLGEKAAIEIATRLGLPGDYFLGRRRAPVPADQYADLLRLWHPLFAEQKEALMLAIRAEHAKTTAAIKEMRARGLLNEKIPEEVLPPEFTRPAQRDLAIGADAPKPKPRQKGRKG